MTPKLVFLVGLIVFAFCFSLSDGREMPMGEVDCIGICPPNDPGCICMTLAASPAPMDVPQEMSEEAITHFPPSYVTPPPPPPKPMDDLRKMSEEAITHFPPCYVTPPPPKPMDDPRKMSEDAITRFPPSYMIPPPPPPKQDN